MHDHPLGGGPALGLVGFKQCGVGAAGNDGGQLPAEVDRILQTKIQARSAKGGVDVRGVADHDHPTRLVPRGDPRVDAVEATQIQLGVRRYRPQGYVGAEHAFHAGLYLGQAHRRFVVVV